jgi:hypothetical protein
MAKTCNVFRAKARDIFCGERAVASSVLTCVHGHQEQSRMCMDHFRQMVDGLLSCSVCEYSTPSRKILQKLGMVVWL